VKAGAVGRLGNVTKLLQRQQIDGGIICISIIMSVGEPSLPFLFRVALSVGGLVASARKWYANPNLISLNINDTCHLCYHKMTLLTVFNFI